MAGFRFTVEKRASTISRAHMEVPGGVTMVVLCETMFRASSFNMSSSCSGGALQRLLQVHRQDLMRGSGNRSVFPSSFLSVNLTLYRIHYGLYGLQPLCRFPLFSGCSWDKDLCMKLSPQTLRQPILTFSHGC
ncbi:MAG: hypothetical protein IPK25_09465 [Saprospiraceae bacterium]|nr:hypothetical protein [Saprospiraceae bacterium]